jgi:hypothetical protein
MEKLPKMLCSRGLGEMVVKFGALVTVSVSGGFSEREIGCVRGDEGLEYRFLRKKKGLIC